LLIDLPIVNQQSSIINRKGVDRLRSEKNWILCGKKDEIRYNQEHHAENIKLSGNG
jgi:hypothetical protein